MFSKIAVICSLAAVAAAVSPGYIDSAYALGTQAEHTVRGFGGLSSVSKQAKAVDSAYSTVRKSDIRFTNDAGYASHPIAPVTYAHPGHAYGTTAYGSTAYGSPAYGATAYGTPAYAAHSYGAPAYAAHGYGGPAIHSYHAPAGLAYHGYGAPTVAHAAPIGYSHGAALHAPIAKGVVPAGLGVAYSPATAVATSSFSGYGVHYGY